MGELVAVAGAVTAVSAAVAVVHRIVRTFRWIIEGLRCQLRTDMLRVYYRHKDEKCIRQYEKENFEHNFNAYAALGGNTFVADIYNEVRTWEVIS